MRYGGKKKIGSFAEFSHRQVFADKIGSAAQMRKDFREGATGILARGGNGNPRFRMIDENSGQFGSGVARSPDDSDVDHGYCSPGK